MAPVFQAAGTAQNSTGASVNVAWPTHLANDIGLVVIETSGNSATLTPPTGWVALPGTPVTDVATIAGSKLHVWWKRAASNAEAAVATGAATDHIIARLYTFRGCETNGNPWNVTTTGTKTTASTTATVPALVTTIDDTLITMIVGRPDDSSSTTHFGVPVNAGLTGLAEAGEAGTISGNGGGFVVSYGIEATPSNTGTSTLTKGASTTDTYVVLALKAPTELISNTGSFTLSGTTTGLLKNSVIVGTTSTFSLVGNNAGLSKSISLDTSVGTFSLAGTTTGLLFNRRLDKQTGVFTLGGVNTILLNNRRLDTTVAPYSFIGNQLDVNLQRALLNSTGTFSLVGNNSLLQRSVRIDATTQTYAVAGINTGLLFNRQLVSQTGTFSIAGVDVTLQYIPVGVTLTLDTVVGAFSLAGTSTGINKQYYLNTSQAAYQLSGFDLQTTTSRSLQLAPATFVTRLQSNGDFFWYRTTQKIQPVKYRITKRNEWILGRATHMGRRGL